MWMESCFAIDSLIDSVTLEWGWNVGKDYITIVQNNFSQFKTIDTRYAPTLPDISDISDSEFLVSVKHAERSVSQSAPTVKSI